MWFPEQTFLFDSLQRDPAQEHFQEWAENFLGSLLLEHQLLFVKWISGTDMSDR